MYLLHAHILKKRSNAQMFTNSDWSKTIMKPMTTMERRDWGLPGYPFFADRERYFMFHKGQTTYSTGTRPFGRYSEIIFNSPTRPYMSLSQFWKRIFIRSWIVNATRPCGDPRVTLDRTNRGLSAPRGILLDEEEFHDVVSRRPKPHLTDDLPDFVYRFTRGMLVPS